MTQQRVTFQLTGVTCPGSEVLQLERAMSRAPGVMTAYVNPGTEKAYVEYDPDRCAPEGLKAVIQGAGFKTVLMSLSTGIHGRDDAARSTAD